MDVVILTSDYDACLLYNNSEHWAGYSPHNVADVAIISISHMFIHHLKWWLRKIMSRSYHVWFYRHVMSRRNVSHGLCGFQGSISQTTVATACHSLLKTDFFIGQVFLTHVKALIKLREYKEQMHGNNTHTQLHKDNTARHNKKIIAVTIIKNEKQSVRMSLDTSVFQTTTIQYNWSQCEHFVFKHTNIHYHYICVCCLLVFHLNLGRSRVISCELWYERISLLNHSSCN